MATHGMENSVHDSIMFVFFLTRWRMNTIVLIVSVVTQRGNFQNQKRQSALLIFSLQKLQVFTVVQIPLQFRCIFYRQPTVNISLQFLHSIFALVVCKKCSETAVGFVHSEKPVLPLQILAV